MIIALDYDDTFTADKFMWMQFIELAVVDRGHKVFIVTMRDGDEDWHSDFKMLEEVGVKTIFCNGESKRDVTESLGITIDVWIDDRPEGIASGSSYSVDKLLEWREDQKKSGGIEEKAA